MIYYGTTGQSNIDWHSFCGRQATSTCAVMINKEISDAQQGADQNGVPAFEEVNNLPFVVKNPGQANAGKTSHALVGSVDIAPTVLDFAGLPIRPRRRESASTRFFKAGRRGPESLF